MPAGHPIRFVRQTGELHPDGTGLALQLRRQGQGGKGGRYALGDRGAVLFGHLERLPIGGHISGGDSGSVTEDVGVPPHQLVVDATGHIGQVEATLFGSEDGVEVDLEEQIAELLLEMGHRPLGRPVVRGRVGVDRVQGGQGVDGFQHLVTLFEKVPGQRTVGLLTIPRALQT